MKIKKSIIIIFFTLLSCFVSSFAASCNTDTNQMSEQIHKYHLIACSNSGGINFVMSANNDGDSCTALCGYYGATALIYYQCTWETGNWGNTLQCQMPPKSSK